MMKKLIFFALLFCAAQSMAQNRVFDTITFLRGGKLYKITLWTDSLQLNDKKYLSIPRTGAINGYSLRYISNKWRAWPDSVGSGGGTMVYPGAGIPISSGTGWSSSITNNSAQWNLAYLWGDHSLMGYVTGTPWLNCGFVTGTPWTGLGYLTSETSHSDVLQDGDFTSEGLMKRGAASGTYSIAFDIDITGNIYADSAIVGGYKDAGNSSTAVNLYLTQGNTIKVTRTGNAVYSLVGAVEGGNYAIKFVHEVSATAYSVNFNPVPKWSGGTAPTFTNTSGAVDWVSLKFLDGTFYAMQMPDFK